MNAFLFPGQGSQAVGMGKALADQFAIARDVFKQADDALGYSIARLCFEGPEETLKLTANAQPAILACSIAAWKVLQSESDLRPTVAAGHSLGEYSALVCTGAVSFEAAIRLVHLRGKFMQKAVPQGEGAMAALMGAMPQDVETLCQEVAGGEVLTPANYNGAGQIVIAGHVTAIERALAQAKRYGVRRAVRLAVSAPFHCPLMAPAAERLAEELQTVTFSSPSCPVITNVEALPNRDPGRICDLLIQQVTAPVRWEGSVRCMVEMGIRQTIEIGPGKVLSGLVKRINRDIETSMIEIPDQIQQFKRQEAAA